MKLNYILIVAGLFFSCAARANLQFDMMNDKINRLDRELTLLQKRVYQHKTPSVRSGTETSMSESSLDDLYTQLADQNRVVQELTEKTDVQERQIELLEERLNLIQEDMEVRFKELSDQAKLLQEKTTVDKKKKNKEDKKNPKDVYDAALDLLKKGQYEKAESAFLDFMKTYPDSPLAGNANYWLGETYYVRGRYEQAVGIFADGLSKYKNNSKAPDNMLKLGLTLKRLKQTTESCTAFQNLEKEFPKAPKNIKDRAKQEAVKLSCP